MRTEPRRLQLLCPQEYDGATMRVVPCDCCSVGWDSVKKLCNVTTGAEHLRDDPAVPDCPMQRVCRHQVQSKGPCTVRSKGLICESALVWSGLSEAEAMEHPLAFSADTVVTPEEYARLEGP